MKTTRLVLAVAITICAAGCTRDVTSPQPARSAGDAAGLDVVPLALPPVPEDTVTGDGGHTGSGVGR